MIAIKDMEMPIDCKQCPLMGVDGSPRDPFSPMMCIAIWATKRERKHCVEGKILDDCPLVEVQAIPLDKVKEARESVQKYINACDETSVAGINMKSGLTFALEIIDELIESEDEG